jgi:hypothetical protein
MKTLSVPQIKGNEARIAAGRQKQTAPENNGKN